MRCDDVCRCGDYLLLGSAKFIVNSAALIDSYQQSGRGNADPFFSAVVAFRDGSPCHAQQFTCGALDLIRPPLTQ
jgi:hypothetical protein